MTTPSNKFEALLELLINEENEKAEQMFHEIVVEKSRDIYENLASTETKEESVEMEAEPDDLPKIEDIHGNEYDPKKMSDEQHDFAENDLPDGIEVG